MIEAPDRGVHAFDVKAGYYKGQKANHGIGRISASLCGGMSGTCN